MGEKSASQEFYDFSNAVAAYAVENDVSVNMNYGAVQNSFNKYMHRYHSISALRSHAIKH